MSADDGRYIHRRGERNPQGTRTLKLTVDGETQEWVHADDFMDMQKARDDLRREVALINAMVCAARSDREVRKYVVRAVARMGFSAADGSAMLGIIREFAPR